MIHLEESIFLTYLLCRIFMQIFRFGVFGFVGQSFEVPKLFIGNINFKMNHFKK